MLADPQAVKMRIFNYQYCRKYNNHEVYRAFILTFLFFRTSASQNASSSELT